MELDGCSEPAAVYERCLTSKPTLSRCPLSVHSALLLLRVSLNEQQYQISASDRAETCDWAASGSTQADKGMGMGMDGIGMNTVQAAVMMRSSIAGIWHACAGQQQGQALTIRCTLYAAAAAVFESLALNCLPWLHVFKGRPLSSHFICVIGSLSHRHPHLMWGNTHATRMLYPARTRTRQPHDLHQPVMPARLTRTFERASSSLPSCRHHSLLSPTPPSAPPKEIPSPIRCVSP